MSDSEAAITSQPDDVRQELVKKFLEDVVLVQLSQLIDWQSVTGQSSQVDSGYLAQQLVSLLTGVAGSGHRGKGVDLADGSEVKAASTIGGRSEPRWNHHFASKDAIANYLARPKIFFVLFDTKSKTEENSLIRVRVWRVEPSLDGVFKRVVRTWWKTRSKPGNFQLHPPCWDVSSIATNESGNLSLPLMFQAQQVKIGRVSYMDVISRNDSPGKCRSVVRR